MDNQSSVRKAALEMALQLDTEERWALVDDLLASMGDVEISPDGMAEIKRRADAYDAGKLESIPGDEFLQKYGMR